MGTNEPGEDLHEVIRHLTMMDDIFFRLVFSHKDCVRLMAECLMGEEGMEISESRIQAPLDIPGIRGAVLDLIAVDRKKNRVFDFEMQRDKKEAGPLRTEWYHALLAVKYGPRTGKGFLALPEIHVVYIVEKDPFRKGRLLYHVDSRVDGKGRYGDRRHTWYLNISAADDTTPLGRFALDLKEEDPAKMCYDALKRTALSYKAKGSRGEKKMCKELDRLLKKREAIGEARGEARGEASTSKKIARNMIAGGEPLENVAKYSGLSLGEVRSLAKDVRA